ncbi:phosphoinositide-3-kinase, regulatory subunit 4 [Geosmithia morbida]|uniref:non-specific serine/threonine protein kinase n=1 Tax=Geosmithia morbida TaxID=1094350 RepID=A0A9P5D2M3_9HYPO|nr:phosphoinositide-3-kinase, regulatory subunit 4 [Geosmithia morbida]KAF4125238.1 phosphoinositide-3-kinase, regulatory subunit 4 [Geosmithia morbida]
MGQGFSLATPSAGSASIDIPQLGDVQYEKSIGNARFMKSIRGRTHHGAVLVKVLVKPYTEVRLDEYKREIINQRKVLADVPNALAFQRVIETETNGYLVRQLLYSSLYDRLSTRPFLEDIEKKWLAFQLLCALRDCHARDVYHGDIKAQNVVVTSWNWLYLTDFSSAFKPVMLPDDNPGDFSYFFDTSGRRTCYIAPERFYDASAAAAAQNQDQKPRMTWAMDIFSAGCVIAQMFLESEIFSLAQLYKYRRGEYDPVITHLSLIPDKDVRDMIAHMIQLDPEKRYSADQYLTFWKDKVFPGYFYSFLHQYMELITDPSSGNSAMSTATKNLGESDDRVDRVFYDFDKISYFLGHHQPGAEEERLATVPAQHSRLSLNHFPVRSSIPNHEHLASADLAPPEDDGTLIFLTLIVSSMRATARVSSRLRACDILLAFGERLTDEAKLDRVLPYLVALLHKDETDMVMISAIRAITQLLHLVKLVTPINSHVLVEYVLPRMEIALGTKARPASSLVRATYASCLGSLAMTAQRFLEMASSLRADGAMPVTDPEVEQGGSGETSFESVFDNAGRQLSEVLESHTKQLVEDSDVHVRRAFLASVPELCMFFQEQSNDILLTHLITYLNDRDWTLKCAFLDTIVGIAAFIGSVSLEEFMLPLMVQALTDTEESVVQSALHSLAQLAGLGLLSRPRVWELVDLVGRFTVHPNIWIREAAAEFIAMSARFLEPVDVRCILAPLVAPYLKFGTLHDLSDELVLLDSLKRPLPRAVFDQAVNWAAKADRGVFWKSLSGQVRSLSFGSSSSGAARSSKDLTDASMSKVARNDEDEQWLAKLRNLGLKQEDELKLLALREFIWYLSKMRARDAASTSSDAGDGAPSPTGLISLKDIGVAPLTVFFNDQPALNPDMEPDLDPSGPYTIADALLDASMTIDDDSVSRRKRAAANLHKNRVQSVGPRAAAAGRRVLSPPAAERASSMDSTVRRAHGGPRAHGSSNSVDGSNNTASRSTVRHTSSVLSLLDRKDSNKSIPETGTTDANAFGEVDGFPIAQPERGKVGGGAAATEADAPTATAPAQKPYKHTYEGTDPNIHKMLDNMYLENFPRDVKDFGPFVQPISRIKASTIAGNSQGRHQPQQNQQGRYWKPEGRLVATFGEHKGPVSRVLPSPDHVFFITGGHDGTVKVWDSARLERNIAHRARQTHRHAEGTRVTALCFIENSHCFVSCASDGSVHAVKVETTTSPAGSGGVTRYGKLRIVREYQLPPGETAVWCEHFRHESSSVLLLATDRSRILGIDLRLMKLLYVLENPVHHGTPTCLCVDRKRHWLCVGTSHGVVDLWDLRFKMRLRAWGVRGRGAIYRICIHPTKGRGKWVCVSGGTGQGEVTVWDLEKTTCREVYRIGGGGGGGGGGKDIKDSTSGVGPKSYEPWEVDDDRPEGMLARFATNLETGETSGADGGVRAMVVGTGALSAEGDPSSTLKDIRTACFITAGSDKRLRFWDISRPENSCVYSGLDPEDTKPTYSVVNPTAGLTVTTEKRFKSLVPSAPHPPPPPSSSSPASPSPPPSESGGNRKGSGKAGGTNGQGSSGRPPRSTVISGQQGHLMRSHLDCVLDVALLEYPFSMTVSVDRSGIVFVFQ